MSKNVLIEPAATLVLVRDSEQGPQVLMQQRNPNAVFVGGAWVFPGGKLDEDDSHPEWQPLIQDLSENQADQILDLSGSSSPYNVDQIHASEAKHQAEVKALAYWIAVLREAYEEAGLLLTQQTISQSQRDQWRIELLEERSSWLELIQSNQLSLDIQNIHYLSRWVTPPNNTRRYDTRFFITIAPPDQEPSHEDYEAIQTQWLTPEDALSAHTSGEMVLIFPTIITLKAMCGYDSCETLMKNVLAHFERT